MDTHADPVPTPTARHTAADEAAAAALAPLAAAVRERQARHDAEVRAAALLAAADFVRDAHFSQGLTVQEIGSALRHQAEETGLAGAGGEVVTEIVGPTRAVLNEVYAERARQDDKWGEQNHRDGSETFTNLKLCGELAEHMRQVNEDPAERSWTTILLEEAYEVGAEDAPDRIRAELVQVAAVAVAWIEAIDRRTPAVEGSAAR